MKPTEAQVEEQLEWERHAKAQGLSRLHRNTYGVESKDYASSSVYGIASIDTIMPRVIAEIERTNSRIKERQNGVAFKEIAHYLADVEALAAAAIALKLTFDKVFSFKEGNNLHINICDSIGTAVEQECQFRYYEREYPALLKTLKDIYWHESKGTQQKHSVIQLMMNRKGIHWNKWERTIRIKLGGWLLDCICTASGWFEPRIERRGRKTEKFMVPTAEFMDIKDEVMANAELFAPLAWPMLVPPRDWSNEKAGGYYLNELMLGHDMVRRSNGPRIQGETPIQFLNHIQKVAYRLNPFVVSVAETLFDKGYKVGGDDAKFIPIVEMPMPPKPVDIADNKEARQDYKRQAAHVMDTNAQAFRRSCRTRMTMEAVARYKDKDRFYLPWSFDYRGRAYPIPAFLTPHDTDFGKSLLVFADESYLTADAEHWLAFQVATTWGLDKATMAERMVWVEENFTLISRVARDPISSLSDWEGADEPWLFLAACEEYYYCVIDASRSHTRLPVAVDATCSGVQILAGLARDASAARLVNVLPGDEPQDAYRVVAEASMDDIPVRLREHTDRKTTKRTVMTLPYNSKPHSNRTYIREAYQSAGVEPEKDELTTVVKAVRKAMKEVLPGPMEVMEWIEKEVALAIKAGKTELSWTTPSGFVVHQKFMKPEVERVKLMLLGSVTKTNVKTGDSDKVDLQHHKNATSPNLIHSLDASLLHLSAIRFNAPLALIHDSVLCRATDMHVLSELVRETYMYLFAENDYLKDWAAQIGAQTEPPIVGTLEPESVIESTYFFC
jgi:DNA-directed RNA polymerase